MDTGVRIGINGFGRMGFCALRLAIERGFNVVALNASRTPEELEYLYKYDSVHGKSDQHIFLNNDTIAINGNVINITRERDAEKIPWGELGVDYVIDTTGQYLELPKASKHLTAGAKKVFLSSPSKNGDEIPMFVYGVNHTTYSPEMNIVSGASCTTNCLSPLAKVIHDHFGIEDGIMNTIHAMTSKQNTVDGYDKKDLRIGRAGHNIIPSTTGAAKAVGYIIPELSGKLTGMSTRVPVEDVSMVDLCVNLTNGASYEEICKVVKEAAKNEMNGIIKYCDEPLVSCDFINETVPCIFDEKAGIGVTEKHVKLIAWYDNEYGYMNQLLNLLEYVNSVDNAK